MTSSSTRPDPRNMTLQEIIDTYTPESIKQILADHERREQV